jgi:dienelactone hydrolase
MMGRRVSYLDELQPLEGYLVAPDSARGLPGVLDAPSWLNVNESICRRADRLAELGYAALPICLEPVFGQVHHSHR